MVAYNLHNYLLGKISVVMKVCHSLCVFCVTVESVNVLRSEGSLSLWFHFVLIVKRATYAVYCEAFNVLKLTCTRYWVSSCMCVYYGMFSSTVVLKRRHYYYFIITFCPQ